MRRMRTWLAITIALIAVNWTSYLVLQAQDLAPLFGVLLARAA
jgi:hypothetical protein